MVLVLLGLGACAGTNASNSNHPTEVYPDAPFVIAPGDSIRVMAPEDESFEGMLVFESIEEDSRCPVDVTCVWEGEATITLSFHSADGTLHPVSLTVIGEEPEGVEREHAYRTTMGGFVVFLLRLDPYPGIDSEPGATLLLERLFR